MSEDDDNEEDLGSVFAQLGEINTGVRRSLAAVDQIAAKCETVLAQIRRERAREKWRNLAVAVASALAGCLIGALVFGR